jgi:hypothetical protein
MGEELTATLDGEGASKSEQTTSDSKLSKQTTTSRMQHVYAAELFTQAV